MTTQKVTLVIDCASADGTPFTRGAVRVLPSFTRLGDPADQVLIEQAPARVSFAGCTTAPSVDLFPNDLIGPQGVSAPAWSYTVYYDGCPGNPQPWSFQLLSTGGTVQRLSSLAQSPVAQAWQPYMPAPAGTATPGYVPVATGAGEGSAWGPSGTGGSGFPASPVVTGTPAAGQVLTATSPTAADWQDPGAGSGTVTSVSVATANGFAGTVANATSTPAITVKTTVTGLLKGNGTAVSAASSGTDYAPATSGSAILKGNGSGGFSAASAGTDYLAPSGSGAALTGITASQVSALPSTDDLSAIATANATAGNVAMNSHKLTGLADGSAGTDSAAFGQTPAGGNGAPMTTLGDILYENSTPAPARLAGNTTGTKNFLTQTGTGSASAAPAWGTIAAADVPTLNQNTSGTASNLSGTPALPDGTTATTQTAADSSTKLATTAYADSSASTAASGKVTKSGDTMTGYLAPKVATLTDASTVTVNAAAGNDFRLLTTSGIGTTRAIGAPSNAVDGESITIDVQQDSSGSRVVTWTSGAGGYSFGTDGSPTLTTTANAVDTIGFRYHGGLGKWICQGWKLGFS